VRAPCPCQRSTDTPGLGRPRPVWSGLIRRRLVRVGGLGLAPLHVARRPVGRGRSVLLPSPSVSGSPLSLSAWLELDRDASRNSSRTPALLACPRRYGWAWPPAGRSCSGDDDGPCEQLTAGQRAEGSRRAILLPLPPHACSSASRRHVANEAHNMHTLQPTVHAAQPSTPGLNSSLDRSLAMSLLQRIRTYVPQYCLAVSSGNVGVATSLRLPSRAVRERMPLRMRRLAWLAAMVSLLCAACHYLDRSHRQWRSPLLSARILGAPAKSSRR
jgi:hypothetical protein